MSENLSVKISALIKKALPAFCFFVLMWIPIDFITALLWLFAFACHIVAILMLVKIAIASAWKYSKDKTVDWNGVLLGTVRPLTAIIAILISYNVVKKSVYTANYRALTSAVQMKNHLDSTGACGTFPFDWEAKKYVTNSRGQKKYSIGGFATKYATFYVCEPEKQEFSFTVANDKDTSFHAAGVYGEDLKVTYGYWKQRTTIIIDSETDLYKLAKMPD